MLERKEWECALQSITQIYLPVWCANMRCEIRNWAACLAEQHAARCCTGMRTQPRLRGMVHAGSQSAGWPIGVLMSGLAIVMHCHAQSILCLIYA